MYRISYKIVRGSIVTKYKIGDRVVCARIFTGDTRPYKDYYDMLGTIISIEYSYYKVELDERRLGTKIWTFDETEMERYTKLHKVLA